MQKGNIQKGRLLPMRTNTPARRFSAATLAKIRKATVLVSGVVLFALLFTVQSAPSCHELYCKLGKVFCATIGLLFAWFSYTAIKSTYKP